MDQTRERTERRLAAIVFTDIVDYSATVHRDEVLGERLLERQRAVVRAVLPRHGGQEIETGGDSFLIEFSSALSAVQAVIAIQQTLHRVCAEHPDDPVVLLRASIHLGDVEHRDGDLYGDGVNIAARLLPLSPKGGLALSAAVLGLVRQRLHLDVRSIGQPPLKNIETPIDVFVLDATAVQSITLPASSPMREPLPVRDAAHATPASGSDRPRSRSLLAELQRRDVPRTASFYAVGGWLLVQIATQVFPFFDVPPWMIRAFIVIVIAGFPLALVLSWFYQLTPAGLRREDERPEPLADASGPATWTSAPGSRAARHTVVAATVIAVLLAVQFTMSRLGHSAPSPAAAAGDPRPAVAVLPFKTLSADADHAYLASGLHDEVLTRLARIDSIKVISRASTEYYAAQPADLRRIAKDLAVTHLVQGSLQQSGDSSRVSVQLIAADSDSNLWAETYDRPLKDIFRLESEVATAIATALQAKLTGAQQKALASVPTQNPRAYDAYLRGIAFVDRSFDRTMLGSAAAMLNQAVTLDPGFALAWARLARVDAHRAFYGYDLTSRPCEQARNAIDKASRLAPDLGETDLARGYVRFMCDDDLRAAGDAFQQARARLPNSAEALRALSQIEWRQGDYPGVLRALRDAAGLDPRNVELLSSYALFLANDRQFSEARAIADRVLNQQPDDASIIAFMAALDQAEGDLAGAKKWLDSIPLKPQANDVFDPQILQLLYTGKPEAAIAALTAAQTQDLAAIGVNIADYDLLLANAQRAAGRPQAERAALIRAHGALKAADDGTLSDLSASGIYVRGMLCITAAGLEATALEGSDCKRIERVAGSTSQFALTAHEMLAQACVLANAPERAIDSLARLLAQPYSSVRYTTSITPALLQLDPVWAPLRTQPRYAALLRAGSRPSPAAP